MHPATPTTAVDHVGRTDDAAHADNSDQQAHRVSWRIPLLGAMLYTAGTFGMFGGFPSFLAEVGLGLGVLLLAIGTIIVSRAQLRRHGRLSALPAFGGPRSLLSGWMAGGPLLFFLALPEATPVSVSALLALLLGTVFYAVLRLEDADLTARAAQSSTS